MLFFLFLMALPVCNMAQDIQRVKISGKITAPHGEDVDGVTLYNKSSEKGTSTDKDGVFNLEVAENDRVLVTAIQFQTFIVIVDKGIVDSKNMSIYLNPAVNQLEEVIVRPYDLSGNIKADIGKIKTASPGPGLDLSYATLEFGYAFTEDALTQIKGNVAADALNSKTLVNGVNFKAIFDGALSLLFPKKDNRTTSQKLEDSNTVSTNLLQRFPATYIEKTFKIPPEKAADFIFYAEENGLTRSLLKPENEMDLLDFMFVKSREYILRNE